MAEHKYVVFKLNDERYGLPIESVERILPDQPITRIPRTPKMLLGVFELRGTTLPAIDARQRFGLEPATQDARNLVVVASERGRCALRVDAVDGIIALSEDEIEEQNDLLRDRDDDFFHSVGKQNDQLTVLLDPMGLVPKNLRGRLVTEAA